MTSPTFDVLVTAVTVALKCLTSGIAFVPIAPEPALTSMDAGHRLDVDRLGCTSCSELWRRGDLRRVPVRPWLSHTRMDIASPVWKH